MSRKDAAKKFFLYAVHLSPFLFRFISLSVFPSHTFQFLYHKKKTKKSSQLGFLFFLSSNFHASSGAFTTFTRQVEVILSVTAVWSRHNYFSPIFFSFVSTNLFDQSFNFLFKQKKVTSKI